MSRNYLTIGAVAIVVALAGAYRLGEAAQTAVDEHQNSGLLLNGDVALWTVAIKPDKTADFEKVLAPRARCASAIHKAGTETAGGWLAGAES